METYYKEQMIAFWIDLVVNPEDHYYMPVCFPAYAHPLHTGRHGQYPMGDTIR
jgi:hypothetical protein